jgi:PAS domain-containing protein
MDRPEPTESDVSDPSRNGWHLAEGHALLAAIVESSADAIIGKDLNGIILSWNKAAERIFGYTAREAIGQSITILSLPECTAEILARIRQGERIEHFRDYTSGKGWAAIGRLPYGFSRAKRKGRNYRSVQGRARYN